MNKNLGKILYINLTNKKVWKEDISVKDMKNYLGGRGLASKKLLEMVGPEVDPMSPKNVLIFAPGCLNGTHAPTAGRTTVVSKSPATGMFMKSSIGGHWGVELRYAGYDMLIVVGKADKLVYLTIENDKVNFVDASKMKGMDVRKTTKSIAKELDDPEVEVLCIGPAGENLVKFASIMGSMYHAAARGGLGAVMGYKNLKAVAVRGNIPITLADKDKYIKVCAEAFKSIKNNGRCRFYHDYGTAGVVMGANEKEALPTKNFQIGSIENAYDISGMRLTEEGYLIRRESCAACTIACKRYCHTKSEKFGKAEAGGPEYETLTALGSGCLVTDMDAILKANELCNILGLDTISAGAVIQWAFESKEKGYIKEKTIRGHELNWGNAEAMLELLEMIALRQGIGDLLAEGVKLASEKIGGETWKWAVHAKGLEQSGVDTRRAKAYALAFATNPRGPDHLYGQPMAEFGFSPEALKLVKKLTGSEKYADPMIIDKKPEIVCWHEDCFVMTDSLGLCSRATLSTYAITPEMMRRMYIFATGIEITEDEFVKSAQRVINLERSFNIREGADRKKDTLPWRLMNQEIVSSKGEKAINSFEEMSKMLDIYYELRGWDKNGIPTNKTLGELGLDWVVK